jgi:transposase
MATTPRVLPDLNQLDPASLRALILSQHEQLLSRDAEIEHLRLLIAKLRRMQFGRKSEKVERQIEQLQLRLDELETKQAENEVSSAASVACAPAAVQPARKPARRPLPEHLPRETQTVLPKETKCPECGGELKHLGEDVAEMLEYVPEHFKVIRRVRPKLACGAATRSCKPKRRAAQSREA